MPSWAAKGKARDLSGSAEGNGGTDGVVLPLRSSGSGTTDIIYSLDVSIGGQSFSLQVDTGSSDLWVASKDCGTTPCGQTNGRLYEPSSSSTETGKDFGIGYLSGEVDGPILWDNVEIGGYSIENQAFAAADSITDEPLSSDFNGILGLALPLNSVIAQSIEPVTTNAADGAAWASNLFSITPISSAPGARFLSLSLSRPGDDRIPSTLGIGRHPSFITSPSSSSSSSSSSPSSSSSRAGDILYDTLIADKIGILWWKVGVRAITVYVNGEVKPVEIGRSGTGAVFPSAILDSGVPLILTTRDMANGIYGALGIGPGQDGQYYVPCSTPLNLTITLDDRPEIPIHPLDLTTEPPKDNSATYCIGLIQAADNYLGGTDSVSDIILGVPFLRNVYTVMAYTPPDADGEFPINGQSNGSSSQSYKPRLGLLSLTDPTLALDDFHRVRVLNQPISTGGGTSNSNSSQGDSTGGRKGLSVGIIVLVSLLAFFALCFTLFALRWWLYRRRYSSPTRGNSSSSKKSHFASASELTGFGLAAAAAEAAEKKRKDKTYLRGGGGAGELDMVPTDELRYEAYMQYNAANDTETENGSRSMTPANSNLGHGAAIGAGAAAVGGKVLADDGHASDVSGKGIAPPGIGVDGIPLAAVNSRRSRFSEDSNDGPGGHGHSHSGTGADELGYKPIQTRDSQSWWADDTLVNPTGLVGARHSPANSYSQTMHNQTHTRRDSGGEDVGEEHGFLRPDERQIAMLEGETLRPSSSSYPPALQEQLAHAQADANHVPLTPPSPTHQRSFSAAVPLLDAVDGSRSFPSPHTHHSQYSQGSTGSRSGSALGGGAFDEFGVGSEESGGMAGVGTAMRNSQRLGGGLRRDSVADSVGSGGFGRTTSR